MSIVSQSHTTETAPLGAPYNPANRSAANASTSDIGDVDFSQFYEQLLADLDSDGDRQISDQEWASYRASKAARGEYIASPGSDTASDAPQVVDSRTLTETLFRAAFTDDAQDD
ncbi:hypothetical protein [Phaeobacter porticola]|uniref:EF-hand domain-containing protein n=1 Tax=Phaeobacter porticola TaxID=1844006 RepID=A0A1L3I7L1_9RHOB|nr:hypothetical protein [Phaeobacter porticola]APG48158.1 hypothetical protein PhaeoP97_02781 [Phaeobacter porticola]